MENNKKWVDDRLSALDPPSGWKPDSAAALPRMRERDRVYRGRRARWIWSAMAASVFGLAMLLTPARCAFGVCRSPEAVQSVAPAGMQVVPTPPAPPAGLTVSAPQRAAQAPAPVAATPQRPAAPLATQLAAPLATPAPRSFKESGNPDAPLTCEIFTDYECPHCATVFDQVVPMLLAEYVQTGKMKFIHRDLPLPQHQYARLAARYANAAGRVGQYEIVVNQIFRTQPVWARTGDVDSQVAQVLPPDAMEKVRTLVTHDGHLEDTVAEDLAIARQDILNQTPSLVVTYKGKRQVVAPVPPYSLLKNYLDELLTK